MIEFLVSQGWEITFEELGGEYELGFRGDPEARTLVIDVSGSYLYFFSETLTDEEIAANIWLGVSEAVAEEERNGPTVEERLLEMQLERERAFAEAFRARYQESGGGELWVEAFEHGWSTNDVTDLDDWGWVMPASGYRVDLTNRTIWIDATDGGWFEDERRDPAEMADALWAALNERGPNGERTVRAEMLRADTLQAGEYPRVAGGDAVGGFSSAMGMTRDGYHHVREHVILSAMGGPLAGGAARAAGGAAELTADALRAVAAERRAAALAGGVKQVLGGVDIVRPAAMLAGSRSAPRRCPPATPSPTPNGT